MIVDFISVKQKLHQLITLYLRESVRNRTPLFRYIGNRQMHEGDQRSYETIDKQERKVEFQKVETILSFPNGEMDRVMWPEILAKIDAAAVNMAQQMEGGAFKKMFQEIEKSGNLIPGNPPFSPDAFLQALEIMDVDFDDARDKPQMPTVFMHPSQLEKVKAQEANMTEAQRSEFQRKQETILDRKYEEYVSREGKRKLVD